MNVSQVANASFFLDLQKQIIDDAKSWEQVADKIQLQSLSIGYRLLSRASSDIDIFNMKNVSDGTAVYHSKLEKNLTVKYESAFTKDLENEIKDILKFMIRDADDQRAIRITATFFKDDNPLKTVSYIKKD